MKPDTHPPAASVPSWLPDWRDVTQYPGPDASMERWAWEFLRRNPQYQQRFRELGDPASWVEVTKLVIPVDSRGERPLNQQCRQFQADFVISPPTDPASDHPPDFTLGTGKLQLTMTLDNTTGLVSIEDDGYLLHTTVDVRLPIPPQLRRIREQAEARQSYLETWGVPPFSKRRSRAAIKGQPDTRYRNYLRCLDAEVRGVPRREIAAVLLPDTPTDYAAGSDPVRTVRDWLKAAHRLRDRHYRFLLLGIPPAAK